MGLDQYAYVALKEGANKEFFEDATFDSDAKEFVNPAGLRKPREIAYWRKHPNLHGWMERLWGQKNNFKDNQMFNGVELELTWDDLNQLENDIKAGVVSRLDTQGFFFGSPSDDHYRDYDLEFIAEAKTQIFLGFKVFYNSSW